MKQRTIWTIAIIMGLSFMGLLFLQLSYIQEMAEMKKEQFDESVNRALYQASRNLELNETLRYLEKDVKEIIRKPNVVLLYRILLEQGQGNPMMVPYSKVISILR